jgi:hypothetical protein
VGLKRLDCELFWGEQLLGKDVSTTELLIGDGRIWDFTLRRQQMPAREARRLIHQRGGHLTEAVSWEARSGEPHPHPFEAKRPSR